MAQFSQRLLTQLDVLREGLVSEPNVDEWRFPPQMQRPLQRNDKIFQKVRDLIVKSPDRFDTAARLLADDRSRDLLALLYCFRALGPSHVKLPTNRPAYWRNYELAKKWWKGPSERIVPPFEFALWSGPFLGSTIEVECWLGNIVFSFLARQYFFETAGAAIKPAPGDIVIDAGGCFGDTALAFSAAVGEGGQVYCFEPIPRLAEIIQSNLDRNPALANRINLLQHAAWNASGQRLKFRDSGASSVAKEDGGVEVTTKSIDDLVEERALKSLDFIKMDIEGAEHGAIAGAAQTIRRFKPKLAISVYHRLEDLIALPAVIKQMEPSYELFLDHYTIHGEESILYAIARGH